MRLRPTPQPFFRTFRGKPEVILGQNEGDRMYGARKGSTTAVEMSATARPGTEVWIRHNIRHGSSGRDNGRAGFQCLARVTKSEKIRWGTLTSSPVYRTTFVLIAEPERSEY